MKAEHNAMCPVILLTLTPKGATGAVHAPSSIKTLYSKPVIASNWQDTYPKESDTPISRPNDSWGG